MKLHGCDTENCFTGKKRIAVTAAFLLLLAVQLAVLICYGGRKSGFHEDEFYSYYSTNKTAGLFVNDRQWVERDDFRNDFVVLEGERFRYGIVKQMQSWDVHPPFYYYVLHTVCSLFPGVFDKWLGIAVNLLAYVPCFFLLAGIVYLCAAGDAAGNAYRGMGRNAGRDNKDTAGYGEAKRRRAVFLSFAVCAAWGFSAAVISGVMFIRMYQWLTLFVLLCAWLHVRAIERREFGARFLLPLIPTVFLGFMTQYYYIIYHFFMGVGMCFLFLRKRRIKELSWYGASCGAGLLLAILYYPSSLSHIFRGYRGTEAVSEFGNAGNTMERLRFFTGLFNDYVMNGTLAHWFLLICLLWVTAGYAAKRRGSGFSAANAAGPSKKGVQTAVAGSGKTGETGRQAAGLLLFACAGYFFTVSKTALLLGETSNRYQLPVYGLLVFLLLYFFCRPVVLLWERAAAWKRAESWKRTAAGKPGESGAASGRMARAAGLLLLFSLILGDVLSLRDGKVFFLYEQERPVMEYVRENADVPVVVFYNEASPDNVWRLSDELMEFPRVYLASQGNPEQITDEKICESGRLVVYVADREDKESCLENLLRCNEKLTGYRVAAEKGLWTLYEME